MKATVRNLATMLIIATSSVSMSQANAKVIEPHVSKSGCYEIPDLTSIIASAKDALPLPEEVSGLLVDTANERLQQLQDRYWQHFTFNPQWGVYPPMFNPEDFQDPVNNHVNDPLYGSQYWDHLYGSYRYNI